MRNVWDELDDILEGKENFPSNEEFMKRAEANSKAFLSDMEVEQEALTIKIATDSAAKEIEFAQRDAEFAEFMADIETESARIQNEVNVIEAIHEVANAIALAKLLRK